MTTLKSIPLKVKILSLGAEAQIIRIEEARLDAQIAHCRARCKAEPFHKELYIAGFQDQRGELAGHRKGAVRCEARDALLAYCFLRGKRYLAVEPKRFTDPDWKNIERMVLKYGKGRHQDLKQSLEMWQQSAANPQKRT